MGEGYSMLYILKNQPICNIELSVFLELITEIRVSALSQKEQWDTLVDDYFRDGGKTDNDVYQAINMIHTYKTEDAINIDNIYKVVVETNKLDQTQIISFHGRKDLHDILAQKDKIIEQLFTMQKRWSDL